MTPSIHDTTQMIIADEESTPMVPCCESCGEMLRSDEGYKQRIAMVGYLCRTCEGEQNGACVY